MVTATAVISVGRGINSENDAVMGYGEHSHGNAAVMSMG